MHKLARTIVTITILIAVLFIGTIAVLSAPGGSDDPLVSRSYVDGRIDELKQMISSLSSASSTKTDNSSNQTSSNQISSSYVPVSAKAGQNIIGGEGTEIILRSGQAKGFVSGANGIINATDGSEIMNGDTIKINNLLIVPRNDGRGITAVTDIWIIVKGEYKIQ